MSDAEQATSEETQEQTTEQAEPVAEPAEGAEPAAEAKPDDAADGEKAEAAEEKPEGEEAKPETPTQRKNRPGPWQRKAEKLEREREQWARERAILLEQQARTAAPQPGATSTTAKTPEEKAVEWIDSVVARRMEQAEAQRARQARQAEFQRRANEVRAANPDFDEVMMGADVPVSEALSQALLTSEQGPAIMYELAKSPDELARISALPPLEAARAVGRLEAKFAPGTATPQTKRPAVRPPVPPTSVNGSRASTRDLAELPIAEFKKALRSRG